MRPLKVVMSAFGSYADTVTVDFTKAGHGIFLITGDTGSGKTTIFDAITYALYDRTSGGKRDGQMMRSQYAKDMVETYVSYTFSYGNQEYTVRRTPLQWVRGKRKNKDGVYPLVKRLPTVELTLPDKTVFPGKLRETDAKIVEIVGLDANQFTQIAMIAQDDFMELLHAKSEDRKAIFARIFDTSIYQRIQDALYKKRKELYAKLEEYKKRCVQELEGVQCIPDSVYAQKWAETPHFSEGNMQEILELLAQITEEARQWEMQLHKEAETCQKQLEDAQKKQTQAEQLKRQFLLFDRYQKERLLLEEKKEEMVEKERLVQSALRAEKVAPKEQAYLKCERELNEKELLKQQQKEQIFVWEEKQKEEREQLNLARSQQQEQLPQIEKEQLRLQEVLPEYEKKAGLEREQRTLEASIAKLEQETETLSLQNQQQKARQAELKARQEEFEGAAAQVILYEQKLQDIQIRKARWNEVWNLCRDGEKKEAQLEAYRPVLLQKEAEAQKKDAWYRQQNHLFIAQQAGILAEELVDGKPCPVCGATQHPKKAKKEDAGVSRETVKQAQLASQQADRAMQSAQQEYQKRLTETEILQEQILKEGEAFFQQSFEKEKRQMLFEQEKETLQDEEKRIQKLYKKAKNESECYQKEKQMLAKLELQMQETQQKLKNAQTQIMQDQTQLRTLLQKLKECREKLPDFTQEQVSERLTSLANEKKQWQIRIQTLSEQYEKVSEQLQKLKGQQEAVKETVVQLEHEKKILLAEFSAAILQQGFADAEAYQRAICPEKETAFAQQECQKYRESCLKNEENYKRLKEELEGKEPVLEETVQEKISLFSDKLRQLRAEEKRAYQIASRNQEAEKKATKEWEKRQKMSEQYANVNELERTANGSLSGKAKIDFQTFIQRTYFQEMIHEANKRLNIMTNGQFLLQCRSMDTLGTQGAVGLDLDVYQPVSGKTRDVKTLSGGESFMAALALAFGMADVIQQTAGKVHLDMMFIDEGFGSLDEASREQAIKVLNDLTGDSRLIGIISHVTELKEQIGQKLIVSKTDKGSALYWECEER
ncbi:MAG: AAA family ATPase [Lachnospiraceae bacterium]